MSLLDDVSIVVTPNGYKAGTLYGVIPTNVLGSELLSQPVNLVADFTTNSGGVIVDADTFTTAGGTLDGIVTSISLTIGKRYKLIISGNTTSSGFTFGKANGSGNEYGSGFGTHYFIALHAEIWFRQSTAGTTNITSLSLKEYTASDMDVTRATAATRVDENGLVNYAEVLGSELVTDGDFTLTGTQAQNVIGTYWTTGAGWSIANGLASSDGSQSTNSRLVQNSVFENNKTYKLTFDLISNGQELKFWVNGSQYINSFFSSDTYTIYINTTTSGTAYFEATANFIGSVTNVSVKEADLNNVPRIDYTGGGCPHILAEPQRTNLVTLSEDFSNAAWTKPNSTIATTTETVSPDGTENASKLTVTAAAFSGIYKTGDAAVNKYSMSVFAKKGDKDWLYFVDGNGTTLVAWFNISNGTLGTITNGTATIEDFGNGWYRCIYSDTNNVSNVYFQLGLSDANNSNTPSSGGYSYIWGASKEVGSYATSYIPTSGSTVTRNQDIFTRDGIGSLINSTEGVLFAEISALADDGTSKRITISDGTLVNRITLTLGDNNISGFVNAGSSTQYSFYESGITTTDFNKIAIKYKANDFSVWINGVEYDVQTSGSTFSSNTLNRLNFSNATNLSDFFFGKVKQLQVYDTALTDNQLIQLTGEAGTHFFESYSEMAETLTYTIQ